jgi:hypothetical protein
LQLRINDRMARVAELRSTFLPLYHNLVAPELRRTIFLALAHL